MRGEEYEELFHYLRRLVMKAGYLEADNIASSESKHISSPKKRLELYLSTLINSFKELSKDSVFNIYERFTNVLKLENGEEFKGIDVFLSDSEANTYNITDYSLDELDDFGSLIMELESTLEEVKSGPEPLPPENNPGSGGLGGGSF